MRTAAIVIHHSSLVICALRSGAQL